MAGDIHRDEERLEDLILGQELFLNEMKTALRQAEADDHALKAVVLGCTLDRINRLTHVEPSRTMGSLAIRRLCVQRRLRFLPISHYKGDLPMRTIAAVRALERQADRPLRGFHILAPARSFQKGAPHSPSLLFVRVGEAEFHHIDGELPRPLWRSLWALPFRSAFTLIGATIIFAAFVAAIVPTSLIATTTPAPWWGGHRALMLFWCLMVTAATTSYCWMAGGHRFSREIWDQPVEG